MIRNILRIGNFGKFAGVSFGDLLARIANELLKLGATNARVGELIGTILYLGFFFQKTGITHHF